MPKSPDQLKTEREEHIQALVEKLDKAIETKYKQTGKTSVKLCLYGTDADFETFKIILDRLKKLYQEAGYAQADFDQLEYSNMIALSSAYFKLA